MKLPQPSLHSLAQAYLKASEEAARAREALERAIEEAARAGHSVEQLRIAAISLVRPCFNDPFSPPAPWRN